jgi:transposase
MSNIDTSHPKTEVQPKPVRRRFTAEYKRGIITKAEQCQHGELGALLRREGLYHSQLASWRKAQAGGTLKDKKRGPKANPDAIEVKRLQHENERLQRKLEQAEAIINAQKKLATLVDRLQAEGKA